eukprot:c12781_g1_i2.p1 GENE.c12781_g1_i2~~c12781_g1_i2.p1  ORF type:complete len:113 (+),score=19.91 c12781_g1_i2:732-1070(+)
MLSVFQSHDVEDVDTVHHVATSGFTFQLEDKQPAEKPQATEVAPINTPTVATGRRYTIEFLMSQTGAQLKEIAKPENVRPTGSKKILSERIMSICNPLCKSRQCTATNLGLC